MSEYRVPPKPAHFDSPRPGCCRWCNYPVTGKRKCWHEHCQMLAAIAGMCVEEPRRAYARWVGRWYLNCAHCKQVLWWRHCQLDHIEPLKISHRRGIAAWMPANLQPLCSDCHKAKTRADMQTIRQTRHRTMKITLQEQTP